MTTKPKANETQDNEKNDEAVQTASAAPNGQAEDLTPTPTQAENDEAKRRKAAGYQSRDMKAE